MSRKAFLMEAVILGERPLRTEMLSAGMGLETAIMRICARSLGSLSMTFHALCTP
ncbi:hypothetical protein D3C72_2522800 [compost metagenome]